MKSPIVTTMILAALAGAQEFTPKIPKVWDEAALKEWATPVAGLNVRPTHMSVKEYYVLPVHNLSTYPVYFPGREPAGYWEMLRQAGPKSLVEPEELKTEADWIEAGRRVFTESAGCAPRSRALQKSLFYLSWIECCCRCPARPPLFEQRGARFL